MDEKYFTQENMKAHLLEIENLFKQNKAGSISDLVTPHFESCDIKEATYVASFDTDERVINPNGVLHGGMTATAMDDTMGTLASFYGQGKLTQTVSFQVSYLRPGVIGEKLVVRVRCMKPGKTVQYLNAEAWSGEDETRLIATATGVYYTKGERPKVG